MGLCAFLSSRPVFHLPSPVATIAPILPIQNPLRRHHPPGRPPLHPQQRRLREKIPPRNNGLRRRLSRLRQRRLARHPPSQRRRLANSKPKPKPKPKLKKAPHHASPLPQ